MTTMLCFQGEMMDSVGGWGLAHHFRHVITDLTLALLQDSGWCGSPSPPPPPHRSVPYLATGTSFSIPCCVSALRAMHAPAPDSNHPHRSYRCTGDIQFVQDSSIGAASSGLSVPVRTAAKLMSGELIWDASRLPP